MKFPCKVNALKGIDLEGRPLHLAIGMFDGVHLGHQCVIEAATHSARRHHGVAGVLTFWPHPSELFRPERPTPMIMDPAVKHRFFFALGADLVIELPFDRSFAAIEAEGFISWLRERLPTLDTVYVGENWRFGRGRKGDVDLLVDTAEEQGISVISMPRLYRNKEAISSTRIRDCLRQGEIEESNSLLGYTYCVEGEVREGRKLGRQLGFPTLNMSWPAAVLRPCYGVYGVRVSSVPQPGGDTVRTDPSFDAIRERRRGAGGDSVPQVSSGGFLLPGVASFGLRPTIESGPVEPLLEVFLLTENCPFSYGDRLHVEWLFFLRPEEKFDGLEELKARMKDDCDRARSRLLSE